MENIQIQPPMKKAMKESKQKNMPPCPKCFSGLAFSNYSRFKAK